MAAVPLPLSLSWPIYEAGTRLTFGGLWDLDDVDQRGAALPLPMLAELGIGSWSCDLESDALSWSPAVHDIFGFPRDAAPSRRDTVARYAEHSRVKMERLRAYAIRHRRGFTLDAEILHAGSGASRFMRLIAAPVLAGKRPIALRGIKMDVTREYR